MYTLKSIVRRGAPLGAALGLMVGAIAPAVLPVTAVYADSLNPLTERSLTLSSSSPGWSYTDGSGNATYAPPNSGANGKKTGNTFGFTTSSDTTSNAMKSLTFQYCTTAAGLCTAPGNNLVHPGGTDDATHSDLNVVTNAPSEVGAGNFATVVNSTSGIVEAVPGFAGGAASAVAGNFVVYYNNAGTWTQSTGWSMSATNVENGPGNTGKNNYIILTKAAGLAVPANTQVKVVFFGTANNYITNPGSGAFFVKINTYSKEYNAAPSGGQVDLTGLEPATGANVIDGGVTVANVMNQSIQITTKVLETMQFSVGTFDPNVLDADDGSGVAPSSFEAAQGIGATNNATRHGTCDRILTAENPSQPANVLQLGDQNADSSLATDHTYSTHSYWRLSSNSSAGATVYYSGHTLANTVGDEIAPIGATAQAPSTGTEQFGLAFDLGAANPYATSYAQGEGSYENADDNGFTAIHATTISDNAGKDYHAPQLFPLVPGANYDGGNGVIDGAGHNTTFAFDPQSDVVPVPLASESNAVVNCVTGKMRYMANIAATTPAGIYTTKVNYIASPQY